MYTENDYKDKCNQLGLIYLRNYKEKKRGTMIEFICPKHESIGAQSKDWSHFKGYSKGCPYCTGRYRTTEEFQKMILNKSLVVKSEYLGSEKPIKIHCNVCGTDFTCNRPIDLTRRHCGCPECSRKNAGLKRRNTQEQFEERLHNVDSSIMVIGKYEGIHKLIKCKCNICGVEWESYGSNLYQGKAGCPVCNCSSGERELEEFLISKKVRYKRQKTFDGCKDNQPLRFDAYDYDNNIAYEFQGEQHFFPIDFSGEGKDVAEENFKSLQRRDQIKKDFCKNNNIKLICIPYWERGNVGEYLDSLNLYNNVA